MVYDEIQQITLAIEGLLGSFPDPLDQDSPRLAESLSGLKVVFDQLRSRLETKLLSNAAAGALRRYFSYHLHLINALGNRLEPYFLAGVQLQDSPGNYVDFCVAELVSICDFLLDYGPPGGHELVAFPAYSRYFIARNLPLIHPLMERLRQQAADDALNDLLYVLLNHMMTAGTITQHRYSSLLYFQWLINELAPFALDTAGCPKDFLISTLLRMNFNHLGFLSIVQQRIRMEVESLPAEEQLRQLEHRLVAFGSSCYCGDLVYDPVWPGINQMLAAWLREETSRLRQQAPSLLLNTSVAHLACYLRAFTEAGLSMNSLSELFRFVSANCSTKRQRHISAAGLAKEYYGITQFTAARVRDQLLKMVAAISTRYFPVVAAISATYYFL